MTKMVINQTEKSPTEGADSRLLKSSPQSVMPQEGARSPLPIGEGPISVKHPTESPLNNLTKNQSEQSLVLDEDRI